MNTTTLRWRSVRLLMAATLTVTLILAGLFIALHRVKDLRGAAVEAPSRPMTDEQTSAQVLQSAREFIRVGGLVNPTGAYLLQSCGGNDEPPYQGSLYITFDVPTITETPAFFRRIARAMTARGWTEGLPDNRHPGGKALSKRSATGSEGTGTSAYYYRHPDMPGRGVLQIYGECGNVGDHRDDVSGFIDVTGQLSG